MHKFKWTTLGRISIHATRKGLISHWVAAEGMCTMHMYTALYKDVIQGIAKKIFQSMQSQLATCTTVFY